jgi:formylglycine-generating enzyme required for sulfatase activity
MGSERGDPDERPVHPRRVAAFWITDVPISWTAFAAGLGWCAPPDSLPDQSDPIARFDLHQRNKIRMKYCEHRGQPAPASGVADAGAAARPQPRGAERYAARPIVAVTIEECERLAARLTTAAFRVALPTEAQWEKAARGGLVGKRFAWGDEPASPERCDFDHFGAFHIVEPRTLPPNGYGLHAMCGGVWEWTRDGYDALAYRQPGSSAAAPATRVLRGGSWSDCADACTVSYRMSRDADSRAPAPNIGFRLVREASPTDDR